MLVMPVYTKMMIERYQEQTTGSSDKDSVICYKGLVYKYHKICSFCAFMLSDGAMFLKSLRPVVTFEQRSDFPFEKDEKKWAFYLQGWDLQKVSDGSIHSFVVSTSSSSGRESREHTLGASWCRSCQHEELYLGDFNLCSGCNKSSYCGRDYQKKDWKIPSSYC